MSGSRSRSESFCVVYRQCPKENPMAERLNAGDICLVALDDPLDIIAAGLSLLAQAIESGRQREARARP